MTHKIEEFMRGGIIEYQQVNPRLDNYLSWIRDIVWGTTTDDNSVDHVEVGKFGCKGYMPLTIIQGVEITDKIIEEYGFLRITGTQDYTTYYRDDFGHIKLDTYGVEHVYMKGKCIKYLHNFQRIFFDYKGYILYPKVSQLPKQEWKSKLVVTKEHTADEMLKTIEDIKKIQSVDLKSINFDFKL